MVAHQTDGKTKEKERGQEGHYREVNQLEKNLELLLRLQ